MAKHMKLFTCQNCEQLLYFENVRCENCGSALGFYSKELDLLTLQPLENEVYQEHSHPERHYRYCANARHKACNWVLPQDEEGEYCQACQLNQTIPNLDEDNYVSLWKKLEIAKHRLVYTLMRLRLPLVSKEDDAERGLAFDFLADQKLPSGKIERILTGHAQGLITININEADDAKRAQMKQEMGEPYRTLLGHFRHEVGHYYWNVLIADSEHLPEYRRLFGDEREDYGEALQQHYQQGAPKDWQDRFISAYASAHSWEDWAETWAHYLHMVDTLSTAYAFGLQIEPRVTDDESLTAEIDRDPYRIRRFDRIWQLWLPLTIAMNSINRSMGQPDLYPFVVADPVVEKLRFVHQVCRKARLG